MSNPSSPIEQLRPALAEFETRAIAGDPESTRYERGVRDALRAIVNAPEGQDPTAALLSLYDPVEFD